jgi:hypothetical protein
MLRRQDGKCAACGEALSLAEADGDHFPMPYILGGPTTLENGRAVHREGGCHPRGKSATEGSAGVDPEIIEASAIKGIIAEYKRRGKVISEDQAKRIRAKRHELEAEIGDSL